VHLHRPDLDRGWDSPERLLHSVDAPAAVVVVVVVVDDVDYRLRFYGSPEDRRRD
jgi:hypothetical protein